MGEVRVLVTGGAGFIGSHVVDRLVAEGADVVVLDDLSSGSEENVNPSADLRRGDIDDPRAVTEAIEGCEVVFHQAAVRSVIGSVIDPANANRVNVGGTLNVLVAARDHGVRRVVSASSSSVYGGTAPRPTPESSALCPRSPYAVSKLAGEHYCRVFHELYGLETVSLRYFNVYGPRQRPDSQYAAVIPLFIDALRTGRQPEVHGDGQQSRDFTFVDDATGANLRAAVAPALRCAGKAYNVAGGHESSLLAVLAALEEILHVDAEPRFAPPRAGDVRRSLADTSAALADLGHRSAVPLDVGLRRTVAWLDEHRAPISGQVG